MRRLSLFLLAAALLSCGKEPSGSVRLLIDGEHAPDALVEERVIGRPPALGGNRFLTGWWSSRKGKQILLTPQLPHARIQVVNLGKRERTLVIDLQEVLPGSVKVKAAGRDLGSFPIADPLEIRLPADLPEGRLNLDLVFDSEVKVLAAGIRPFLPAGKVAGRGADV
ncbi:MAG TPA: hypothetical protein VFR31_15110, partial [Thermoanaerobaculia bacterium]|nr:hypothetical protein [Thermoanaerobaculia bacterium]